MRQRLLVPLLALALGIGAVGGFVAAAVVLSEPDGAETRPPAGGAPAAELPETDRAFLGVVLGEAVEGGGVEVRDVAPRSAAAEAGLRPGDVLLAVDGERVDDADEATSAIADRAPGDRVTIEFLHQGLRREAEVTLGRRASEPLRPGMVPPSGEGAFLGAIVSEITPERRRDMHLTAERGVVVLQIAPRSAAARAGLRVGDVIQSVDGQAIEEPADLVAAIGGRQPGDRVTLDIQRASDRMTLDVELGVAPSLDPFFDGDIVFPPLDISAQGIMEGLGAAVGGPDVESVGGAAGRLLRRLVSAEATVLGEDGRPVTFRVAAGAVGTATGERLVLEPNGGGAALTYTIDDDTRVMRGFRRTEAADMAPGETAVVLTRDGEARALVVFLLPER